MNIASNKPDIILFSVSDQFKISKEISNNQLAHAYFVSERFYTGWDHLYVYANSKKSLIDQHRGAGFLQGYSTYRQIYAAYKNLMVSPEAPHFSIQGQNYIKQQLEEIKNFIQNDSDDLYKKYLQAYMEQLIYMHKGYLQRISQLHNQSMKLQFIQFYNLTNLGDAYETLQAFNKHSNFERMSYTDAKQPQGNCNCIAKMINNQIYAAHSTHNYYNLMIRIYKTFYFPSNDSRVGSQWFSFSSRPGDLISKDDFYVLSNGMIVMQTSLSNYDLQNQKELSPKTIPCWLRQCVAVNLARNNNEWSNYFLKNSSGTHNNQWMIVNPKKLSQRKDIILFVQEAFTLNKTIDMTAKLLEEGYVASYNVPYNFQVHEKLKIPNYFYENAPRALQFKKINKKLNTQQDFKKFLIENNYKDKGYGLAPRYDLARQPKLYGLIDLKFCTPHTLKQNFIWAYSGPSWSRQNQSLPPFDWKDWGSKGHQGMPQIWKFPIIKTSIHFQKTQFQQLQKQQNKENNQSLEYQQKKQFHQK